MNSNTETQPHLKRIKPPYNQQYSDLLKSKVYEGLKLLKDNGRSPLNFNDVFNEIGNI